MAAVVCTYNMAAAASGAGAGGTTAAPSPQEYQKQLQQFKREEGMLQRKIVELESEVDEHQ